MTQFLDEADFDAMREAMVLYDEQRDTVIKRSRDITKASKVAIYCLHRGEMDKADAQIARRGSAADELLPLVEKEPQLRYGSYAGGLEEYAEAAAIFAHFVRTGTILPSAALPRCERRRVPGRSWTSPESSTGTASPAPPCETSTRSPSAETWWTR